MFTTICPKIAPPLRILSLSVICGQPVGHNYPLIVQINSLRLIAFGNPRSYEQLPLPVFLPQETKDDRERIVILKGKVEEAQHRPDMTLYDRSARGIKRIDSEGNLLCTKCRLFKTVDSFSKHSSSIYGRQSRCKICHREEDLHYRTRTLRGIMKVFLHSARTKAAKRSKVPGRSEAGHCAIDLPFLLNLWLKQQGRCAYSDVVMNIEPHTSWKISLERCDDTLGYVPGNVVFICAEFNTSDHSINTKCFVRGSSKWSREKVHYLPEVSDSSVAMDHIDLGKAGETIQVARKPNKGITRIATSSGETLCPRCKLLKPLDEFYLRKPSSVLRMLICKLCHQARMHEYRNSAVGFLKSRLHAAKSNAKVKARKGRQKAGEFDLTFNDIFSLYKKQRGLCYYTGINMTLKQHSTWMCSIERLDNAQGYVSSNIALICCEFQSSDASVRTTVPVAGTAQWSKAKCSMLLKWLRSKKSTPRAK